jgi:hypothetical protein
VCARWLCRYAPSEAASLLAAVLAVRLAWHLTDGNVALAAVLAAWSETLAYYAVMLLRDLQARHVSPMTVIRDLVLEFGLAEALDSLRAAPPLPPRVATQKNHCLARAPGL